MPDNRKKPAVFVDRDNTLISDPGYLRDPDQVRLIKGAAAAVAKLREAGLPVIVVTNQSGIARGYFTEQELAKVHQRMRDLLRLESSDVDAIYFCPFLEGVDARVEKYRKASDLRKPRPGMLLKAAEELSIDLARSWMIGDSARDIQAGAAAGCRTILIQGERKEKEKDCSPDHRVVEMKHAVNIILKEYEREMAAQAESEAVNEAQTAARVVSRSAVALADPKATIQSFPTTEIREKLPAPTTSQEESESSEVTKLEVQDTSPPPEAGGRMTHSLQHIQELLQGIKEDLRSIHREQRYTDFSVGQLAGGIAQALALTAVGFGIYSIMNGDLAQAQTRLLAGVAFQLMALTGFIIQKK